MAARLFQYRRFSPSKNRRALDANQTLQLDLAQTREFFTAFFDLQYREWAGFLSSRLTFAELFAFGLSLFAKSSNAARLSLMSKARDR